MKNLPRWSIILILLLTTGLIILSVARFANKSTVLARGVLRIEGALVPKAKGIRTVFIVVYDEESPMPMPWAAIKETLSKDAEGDFLKFILTKDNMQQMNPNSHKLPQKIRIKARLDRDGQGGVDQPGDLTGSISGVSTGAEGLVIPINNYWDP